MKVLLTGQPRAGKTTLMVNCLKMVPNKQGFVTREILEGGERIGFELVSSLGQTATLASVNSNSALRVSRYGVNVGALDSFIDDLPPPEPGNLLYIDEIGAMELFSDKFKRLVLEYLNTGNSFLGTIKDYDDEFANQ